MQNFLLHGIVCICVQIVISQNFKQQCLVSHNIYRRMHGSPDLVHSENLTEFALEWAKKLAADKKFEHRPNNKYGENLYTKTGSSKLHCDKAVKAWYDEILLYDFDNPGFKSGTGHFTQLIWKKTKKVGCARADTGKTTYVVCNYDPPGNELGKFPENVQRASSSRLKALSNCILFLIDSILL